MQRARVILTVVCLLFTGGLLAGAVTAEAEGGNGRLARIFQNNMVLQREMPVPIWGWAAAGTPVELSFDGQKKVTKADKAGYWKITLDPLKANWKGQDLAVRIGGQSLILTNVLVGEVWLAAGQSNMCMPGPDKDNGVNPFYTSKEAAGKPEVRHFMIPQSASPTPLKDIEPLKAGAPLWVKTEPIKTPTLWSQFARVVRDGIDVPVGIIHVAIGGTLISAWTQREVMEGFLEPKGKYPNWYEDGLGFFNKLNEQFKLKSWDEMLADQAKWLAVRGGGAPPANSHRNYPSALYNARIYPLAPYAIRGVIWQQGESQHGERYGEKLVAMTKQWRELFGQDFHVIWGTLAKHADYSPSLNPQPTFFRLETELEMHKAVGLFGADRKFAQVELWDTGDWGVHWLQKSECGRRMGLAGLTVAYGQKHVYTGPFMTELKMEKGKAIAKFDHVGEGLVYKPSINGISGFYVQGTNGPIRWAEVTVIDKTTLAISHPQIDGITSVGYAIDINPFETLFNSAGLPASPFMRAFGRNAPPSGKPERQLLVTLNVPDVSYPKRRILNCTHVREDGYMFQVVGETQAATNPVPVTAFIPKAWSGYTVEFGGHPVDVKETTKDGEMFVEFEVPVLPQREALADRKNKWMTIAAPGAKAHFQNIDRY